MESTEKEPMSFAQGLTELFTLMTESGGLYGVERIQWFNGGLLDECRRTVLDNLPSRWG